MKKVDGQMAGIYAAKSGKPRADMAKLMAAETWLTANEAVAAGLADAVDAPPAKSKSGRHARRPALGHGAPARRGRGRRSPRRSHGTHRGQRRVLLAIEPAAFAS